MSQAAVEAKTTGSMAAQKPKEEASEKRTPKERFNAVRSSAWMNLLFIFLVPLITIVTMEWIARGTLANNEQMTGFFQMFIRHPSSYILSYILLLLLYTFIVYLTSLHTLATGVIGIIGNVPAVVTYFKLSMRGEPFLPWDLMQINELMDIKSDVELEIPASIFITLGILIFFMLAGVFVRLPKNLQKKKNLHSRLWVSGLSFGLATCLLFGVFLNYPASRAVGIHQNPWQQSTYYKTYGVMAGFLTNLQMINVNKPSQYNASTVNEILRQTENNAGTPLYAGSYAEKTTNSVENPDIIFLMGEGFWNMEVLESIEFDTPLMPNIEKLSQQGAFGTVFSPSYGGGTCDVEFEALTGFSMEHLPAGSKPYQQYMTRDMFSLPQYLKEDGYETLAIHGFGRVFWNREQAYPKLGIDTFIASDDFVDPKMSRGKYISDEAMVERIIEEHQKRAEGDAPVFIHAVTMQNHTTYDRDEYPEDELVNITKAPAFLEKNIVGQLECCATGIRQMDEAVAQLVDYLEETDRPTLLVFWGDHMNPTTLGYKMFEEIGHIEEGDYTSPKLYQTPLLMWSNYTNESVDLGTISAYNISPVMMDLYGLEKPLFFEFLTQQMNVLKGQARGNTLSADNTFSEEQTEEQEQVFKQYSILQYDLMFGQKITEGFETENTE